MYYRSLPLDLRLCRPSCDIDDNSRRDCNAYLRCIAKWSHCVVDIKFGYTIINEGPSCVDIKDVKAKLGPYPMSTLAFDDVVCCGNKRICHGGTWDNAQRNRSVNFCSFSSGMKPWPIDVKITDTRNRSKHFIDKYTWNIANVLPTPGPSKGKSKHINLHVLNRWLSFPSF